jgi:hypothetical protein
MGKSLPRGDAKQERLQFLAEAAKEFTYFKDGWRNHVSHGRGHYSQQAALDVLNHVAKFAEDLATRLVEPV